MLTLCTRAHALSARRRAHSMGGRGSATGVSGRGTSQAAAESRITSRLK